MRTYIRKLIQSVAVVGLVVGGSARLSPTAEMQPMTLVQAGPGDVVISEVEADSINSVGGTGQPDSPDEWIELQNLLGVSVQINGWTIEDNSGKVTALPKFFIAGNGTAIIAANIAQFNALYGGCSGQVLLQLPSGKFGNGLRGRGDHLILRDSGGTVIDGVSWGDDTTVCSPAPAPPPANTAETLQRVSFCNFITGAATPECSPTAVTVSSFTAAVAQDRITIRWQTVSEIDIVGFHLLRATRAEGPFVRINSELIPARASGSPTGAQYEFADRNVRVGKIYFYVLEAVKLDGSVERLSTVQVEYKPTVSLDGKSLR
ncbi:MAG: lamin tail domain-containing protein [Acidobacteria bacterium]|nr:MAG: lamin tail domain-containing protein [Acidobacteriota bacterium]